MIAIVGAMDEEVAALVSLMEVEKTVTIRKIVFYEGILNHRPVVVFKSGIGLVMAAMSLTLCLEHYPITHLINIGTAGGLNPQQKVLDLVIPDRMTYHDFDISVFGNPRDFSAQNRFIYAPDQKLIQRLKPLLTHERVWYGPMVSGNAFISTQSQFDEIMSHFPEAQCCEMEGTALANVAVEYDLPFIVIRSLSDIVMHPDNSMTFDEYLKKASARSAKLCHDLVGLIE